MTKNLNNLVTITGNTYPVKDALKAIGAKWDANLKAWKISHDKVAEANSIVAGAGKASPRASRGFRPSGIDGRRRNYDNECELCGRNKYTCGHCIGW